MKIKVIFSLLLLLGSLSGWSFTKGYNQAWQKNYFAYQWLDKFYDPKYVEDLLLLNQQGGAEIIRMWLYEGSDLIQFHYNEEKGTIKLRPEVIKNLTHFLKIARKYNLKVNLTFLDGNAYKNVADKPHLQRFWWNVFNNKYGKQDQFYQEAIAPIYKLIESGFKDVVTQIDLINEVNALAVFHMFETPKTSMSKLLCKMGDKRPVRLTASLGWANTEDLLFTGILNESCLDFYDIHLYNDYGEISRCSDFKLLSKNGVQIQLGEFGQKSPTYDDELQSQVTLNFLKNAKRCGFQSALAWRLDDTRDGRNPEARHTYISHGSPRKAYYALRDFRSN